jgi:hypothetical protein
LKAFATALLTVAEHLDPRLDLVAQLGDPLAYL